MGFSAVTKKAMACAYHYCDACFWWITSARSRLCASAIYLYIVLGKSGMYILGIAAFYHDSSDCLIKEEQDEALKTNYEGTYELD